MKRKKTTTSTRPLHRTSDPPARQPFIEHLLELRRRLFYVAVSVLIWSSAAYAIEHTIVGWLLRPAHGEKFIYTSVGGGLDFLFRVCLYTGVVMSVPVIIYQVLRYLEPLIGKHPTRFILLGTFTSGVLAIAGMAFGYFLGLPAALNFLLNQFHTSEISALITIQSYFSFVTTYLAGASLIFQVPLVIFLINKFRPLKLRTLFKYERWVIVISLVAAALINPSPRVTDMGIIAAPMILSYQIGILIVWYANRGKRRPAYVQRLLEQDKQAQQERDSRLQTVEYVWRQSELAASLAAPPPSYPLGKHKAAPHPAAAASGKALPTGVTHAATAASTARRQIDVVATPKKAAQSPTTAAARSQKYVNGFIDLHRSRPHRPSTL